MTHDLKPEKGLEKSRAEEAASTTVPKPSEAARPASTPRKNLRDRNAAEFVYKYSLVMVLATIIMLMAYWGTSTLQDPMKTLLGSVCLSLSGAFIIAAVFEVFVRREFADVLARTAEKAVRDELSRHTALTRKGLVDVPGRLHQKDLHARALVSRTLYILQTIPPRPEDTADIMEVVANRSDSRVCLIMVSPTSDAAALRGKTLNRSAEGWGDDFSKMISELEERQIRCEVRTYDGMPACSIYAFDEIIFVGRFLHKDAIRCHQIECTKSGEYGVETMQYLDHVFRKSTLYKHFPGKPIAPASTD